MSGHTDQFLRTTLATFMQLKPIYDTQMADERKKKKDEVIQLYPWKHDSTVSNIGNLPWETSTKVQKDLMYGLIILTLESHVKTPGGG